MLQIFSKNIVFFYTTSEILEGKNIDSDKQVRVGGLVLPGSVKQMVKNNDYLIEFSLTDCNNAMLVRYNKSLPSLFRERQGVVVRGKLDSGGVFVAQELLIKHDEKYRPPNVEDQQIKDEFCKLK